MKVECTCGAVHTVPFSMAGEYFNCDVCSQRLMAREAVTSDQADFGDSLSVSPSMHYPPPATATSKKDSIFSVVAWLLFILFIFSFLFIAMLLIHERFFSPLAPYRHPSESAIKVLDSLTLIQSRIEVGISKSDLSSELGPAWNELKKLIESEESKQIPLFVIFATNAMQQGQNAMNHWGDSGWTKLYFKDMAVWTDRAKKILDADLDETTYRELQSHAADK